MTVFSDKLSRLAETSALVADRGTGGVAAALAAGRGRTTVAVGSGGSIVAAEFFARCRTTLGLGLTFVLTPMQFVLSADEWSETDVWLFSAGANNPDVSAAFRRAVESLCRSIHLVTVREDGATSLEAARHSRSTVTVLPVADPKDGFLATHSLVAMVSGLLFAADAVIECPHGRDLVEAYLGHARTVLSQPMDEVIGGFERNDTVVVLHDPQLTAMATLVETCLWETGIAPVQRVDFRNFAHGRHVWTARHPGTTFLLALTTAESEPVWRPISDALPPTVRRGVIGHGHGGRLDNAVGILKCLRLVSNLGDATGIDPGRPGHGPYADAIYGNSALADLVSKLTPSIRHKVEACQLHDPLQHEGSSFCEAARVLLGELGAARFVGLALDYDGTVVPNYPQEARLGPPSEEVVEELVRLLDGGVQVGFATGRGGSAGEKLREAIPERLHPLILMGYYNGAHVRTLDVDIRRDAPDTDPLVERVVGWIGASGLLKNGITLDRSKVQVSINHTDVVDPAGFRESLSGCPEVAAGDVRIMRSQHSFDVVPRGTTKRRVVEGLARRAGRPDGPVLRVGDSGSPLGNDHELLSGGLGISVGTVCGGHRGAWNLFGSHLNGPVALARILRAARCDVDGLRIDIPLLDLDQLA